MSIYADLRTAYHEAGHVVAALGLGVKVERVRVLAGDRGGNTWLDSDDKRALICACLAGGFAPYACGLSEEKPWKPSGGDLGIIHADLEALEGRKLRNHADSAIFHQELKRAASIVRHNRKQIRAFGLHLLNVGEMSGASICAFFGMAAPASIRRPAAAAAPADGFAAYLAAQDAYTVNALRSYWPNGLPGEHDTKQTTEQRIATLKSAFENKKLMIASMIATKEEKVAELRARLAVSA